MLFYMIIAWTSSALDIKVKFTHSFQYFLHLPQYSLSCPITKPWHMVRKIELQHVEHENILEEFSVGHCRIMVKVTIALAKFSHLIFQISRRWFFIADTGKSFSKRH